MSGFGARLAEAVARRESQIVFGVDPDPRALWPVEPPPGLAQSLAAAADNAGVRADRAELDSAAAVLAHSLALIDAAAPACVAAKPQFAFFEQLGFAGWLALERVCAHVREQGLLLIADAKRGDVPSTAAAYAQAIRRLDADAVTANPLLGRDALAPLVDGAREAGAGVFMLVRTSNPGASDVLDLELATGEPLWERLARTADELGEGEPLKDVGAVTGATVPSHLARMRELMPTTPFLLPGIGAQGGTVDALAPAFAPGRAAGLVSASRSIANAGAEHPDGARREAERLREAAWKLA